MYLHAARVIQFCPFNRSRLKYRLIGLLPSKAASTLNQPE